MIKINSIFIEIKYKNKIVNTFLTDKVENAVLYLKDLKEEK